uniref:Phytocyanin domain-containing protein n=1 Tax=Araucaria cunninghamii TaxID=56994 RepID=A0A0D6QZG7_ARACU
MASRWSWTVFFIFMCMENIVAYQFIVGGSKGWTVPADMESYNKWAGILRFQIGDTLLFKYDKEVDSVLQVTKQGYSTCNTSSPIAPFKNGNTVFNLTTHGPFYFISGNASNCQKGEKLIVVVLAPCHWGRGENCGKNGSHSSSPTPAPAPTLPFPDPSPSPAPASSPGSSVSPSPGSSVSPSSAPTPSPSPSAAPASSPGSSVSPSSAPTPSPSPSAVPTPGSATSPAPSATTVPAVSPSPSSGAAPPIESPTASPSESPLSSPPPPSAESPENASPPSKTSPATSAAARSPVVMLNLILPLLFAALLRG